MGMSKGPTAAQKQATAGAQDLLNTQKGALTGAINASTNQALPAGQSFLDTSKGAFQPAIDYWSKILSGDAGAMTSALAPEISQIGNAYQTAGNSASMTSPRGGFRSTTMANLPFQQAAQVGNLFSTLRPTAANALSSIGGATGGLGTGLTATGIQGLTGAGSGATGTAGGLMQSANTQAAQGNFLSNMLGSGLGALVGAAIPGGGLTSLLKKPGSTPAPGTSGNYLW